MSTAENKAMLRRYFSEVWNQGNFDLLSQIVAPDILVHDRFPGQTPGREGVKNLINQIRTASPDIYFNVEDMIAEGDKVVTRWTARGTQQGELLGVPPTGKQVEVTAIVIDRIANGKIVEHWAKRDDLGLLQQLGAIPGPAHVTS
jgi:steroid delta-isomerase-like uncharacterized protein